MTSLKETLISTATDEWLNYNKRFAKGTQQNYRFAIMDFIEYSDFETIDQLNCRVIEQYLSSLLDNLKNSTINKRLMVLKSFCKWLSRNYDAKNCTIGIQRLREDPIEPRILTWEEYQKVLAVCSDKEADIVKFICNTGLRSSEFISLRWGNVSKDFKMLKMIGKGKKLRYIPLNEICREILQKYERGQDDTPLPFVRRFSITTRRILYKICFRLSKRAGIPVASPHCYRSLFATELLRRGVPISHVSKLLGHSSIAITEKAYIHFQPDFLNGLTDVLCKGVI